MYIVEYSFDTPLRRSPFHFLCCKYIKRTLPPCSKHFDGRLSPRPLPRIGPIVAISMCHGNNVVAPTSVATHPSVDVSRRRQRVVGASGVRDRRDCDAVAASAMIEVRPSNEARQRAAAGLVRLLPIQPSDILCVGMEDGSIGPPAREGGRHRLGSFAAAGGSSGESRGDPSRHFWRMLLISMRHLSYRQI